MDMKKLLLVFAILSLSLVQFSSLVHAQDAAETIAEGTEWVLGEALGFPDEWLTVNGFIFNFFIPFIGVWAIVLGFLRVIRIFETESRLELIISFAMAFSTLPLGWFVPFVQWVFGIGGAYATVIFMILFFVGTGIYAWVRGMGWWGFGGGRGGEFDTKLKLSGRQLSLKERELSDKIAREEAKDSPNQARIVKWREEYDKVRAKRYRLDAMKARRATGRP